MKEQEFRNRLHHLYGDIPEETHLAFMQAVTGPKREKKPMSVPHFRLLPVLLLLLTMLACCTAAYGSTSGGIDWYYHSVMDKEYLDEISPGLYDDIIKNVRFMPDQEASEDDLINITVTEVSWIPERRILTLYMIATAKNPEEIELCSAYHLNIDGFEDDRVENWLWIDHDHFGPILEQVEDPSKDIWFLSIDGIYLGEGDDHHLGWCDGLFSPGKSLDYMAQVDMARYENRETLTPFEHYSSTQQPDQPTFDLFEQYAQQNKLPIRIDYTLRPYDKENDIVEYKNLETKSVYVTVDLTPKSH